MGAAAAGFGALAFAPVLGACSSSSSSNDHLTVALSTIPNLNVAPYFVARDRGLFTAQHLVTGVAPSRNSTTALQQLVGGHATVARLGAFTFLQAVADRRVPLTAVAIDYRQSVFGVTSLASRPVRTFADLAGKTVGLPSFAGGAEEALDASLEISGTPKKSVKRILTGTAPAAAAFLKDGRADAILSINEQAVAIRRAGTALTTFNLSGPNPAFGEIYVVTTRTLDTHKDRLRRFFAALRAGYTRLADDATRDASLAELSPSDLDSLKDPAAAMESMAAIAASWRAGTTAPLLHFVPDAWERGVRALVDAHVVGAIANPAALVTNEVLPGGTG